MIVAIVICPLVSSPLKVLRHIGACGLLLGSLSASAQELQLRIDDIDAPAFSLHGIEARLQLATPSKLNIRIARVRIEQREWLNLTLQCPQARIERALITCLQGVLEGSEKIPFSFQYWPTSKRLEFNLQPTAAESWQGLVSWQSADAPQCRAG